MKWSVRGKYPIRTIASGIYYKNPYVQRSLIDSKETTLQSIYIRLCSTKSSSPPDADPPKTKKGMIKQLKQMYKDYWYVLLPVHVANSIVWFGSFYYIIKSGVDVAAVLQTLGFSESIIRPLRNSTAGYFALSLALYKLATPLRYAVTLGGTTVAIRKLKAIGLIRLIRVQEKRNNLQGCFQESKTHYQAQIKGKRPQVMWEMKHYKTEMRNLKNIIIQKPTIQFHQYTSSK